MASSPERTEWADLDVPRPTAAPARGRARHSVALTLLVLVVVGSELALIGAFLVPSEPRVVGVPLPLGPIVALVGNLVAGVWGARLTGTLLGTVAAAVGWFAVVLPLSAFRPEGDLVLATGGNALMFLLLGALAWAGAAVVAARWRDRAA